MSQDSIESLVSPFDLDNYRQLPNSLKQVIRNNVELQIDFLLEDIDRVESPIEKIFLIYLNDHETSPFWENSEGASLVATAQFPVIIGKHSYRVDFSISYHDTISSLTSTVFVELDGHDFHEKTKEQAANDKKRERLLMNKCDGLLRFTGSEVYHNPQKCVESALSLAREKYHQKMVLKNS